jgi:hypothetical protein
LLHALDIALHSRDIDYRDGGIEGGNRSWHDRTRVAGYRGHSTQLSLSYGSMGGHQSLSKIE